MFYFSDTVSKDATATLQNDIVYTVQAQNELTTNDNGLSFSISTVPASSSFDIDGKLCLGLLIRAN